MRQIGEKERCVLGIALIFATIWLILMIAELNEIYYYDNGIQFALSDNNFYQLLIIATIVNSVGWWILLKGLLLDNKTISIGIYRCSNCGNEKTMTMLAGNPLPKIPCDKCKCLMELID